MSTQRLLTDNALEPVFPGDSELAQRMRKLDWSRTALGPVESWPETLIHYVAMILELPSPAIIFWGPEQTQLYNDGYSVIMGPRHPGYLGAAYRECWPDTYPLIYPWMRKVLDTGEVVQVEETEIILTRYGFNEEAHFTFTFSPLRDDGGAIAGILQPVNEVTAGVLSARRAETLRALTPRAHSHNPVKDTIEALSANPKDIPFALIYLCEESRLRLVVGTDNVAQRALSCPGLCETAERTLETDTPLKIDNVSELLGGNCFGPWPEPVRSALIVPVGRSAASEPKGAVVFGISPRLHFDEKYRGFMELAAGQIATAITTESVLKEAQGRAEALTELDRAKTVFFSNVSHELRSPLTLILGPVEDALTHDRKTLSRDTLELVHRNALRLQKLVNTLLDFSHIEAGRMRASFEPTDLCALTTSLAGNFQSAIEGAGLKFTLDCAELPEPVYVDPSMWERIVFNLISNAFKFTFKGEIRIELSWRGDHAELAVHDTGAGIPQHELPRIFERFHRVESTRGRSHEGTGIGLALAHELVKLHGGAIDVTSAPGKGTVFRVSIPAGPDHLPQDRINENPQKPVPAGVGASGFLAEISQWNRMEELADVTSITNSAETARPPVHPDARILVADDNADMRRYIKDLLAPHWTVETASDGAVALTAATARPPDLIISDVMMPGMGGLELLKALRADERTRAVPIVLLSARPGEQAKVEGFEAGADDYLIKPFGARELLARVRSQLALARMRRDLIIARERAEQAARSATLQKEDFYSLLMQAANPFVILRGPEFMVELANPPACRIWGRDCADVVGRPLFESMPELMIYKSYLDGVMTTGIPYEGKEAPADFDYGKGMQTFYFNFVYSPLRDAQGKVDGILVIAFDVTDEVIARKGMDRLRMAAEAANRAKDEFLAMLGHELRNPLSPILTAVQVMRLRGLRTQEQDIIERQVGHLTRLIDDLLDVARIARGKIDLRKEPMEIADAVLRALEMASPLLEQRRHRVDVEVPREGLGVAADRERLAQVISNLLTNAAKYSDPGSRITVLGRCEDGRVQLTVKDEGIGIPAGMLEEIFELFVQQPQAIDRAGGGLGLGLAIVRNLVRMHGGRVIAKSDGAGKGSEFLIELPAVDLRAGTEIAAAERPQPRRGASGKRILMVDDNADVALTLKEALEVMGHTVAVAEDGPSALETARRFHPEVALLDIGLPAMDGYELAQRLRAMEETPDDLRLIAVTGYGLDRDRERAAAAGFDAHIVKPVDLGRLVQVCCQ